MRKIWLNLKIAQIPQLMLLADWSPIYLGYYCIRSVASQNDRTRRTQRRVVLTLATRYSTVQYGSWSVNTGSQGEVFSISLRETSSDSPARFVGKGHSRPQKRPPFLQPPTSRHRNFSLSSLSISPFEQPANARFDPNPRAQVTKEQNWLRKRHEVSQDGALELAPFGLHLRFRASEPHSSSLWPP